jgi:hypothetical protein
MEIVVWYWWKFGVLNNDIVREMLKKYGFDEVPGTIKILS